MRVSGAHVLHHRLESLLYLLHLTRANTARLFFSEAIDKYIDRCGLDNNDEKQLLNLIEDVSEIEYTGDSTQLNLNEIEFFPPGYTIETHYMSIPGMGFGNIAAEYAAPFETKIKMNSKVIEIEDAEDGPATVKYVENGVTKAIRANTILVTVSLGVLKAGNIVSAFMAL